MAKFAKNDTELFSMMNFKLRESLELMAQDITERWKELLWQNFYLKHAESDTYKRTYEIYNSIVYAKPVAVKNGFMVQIYADMNILSQAINGNFIQHKQADFPLYQLIEEGYHIFGNGWVEGAFAFQEVLNELKNGNFFKDELQRTFNIKII